MLGMKLIKKHICKEVINLQECITGHFNNKSRKVIGIKVCIKTWYP